LTLEYLHQIKEQEEQANQIRQEGLTESMRIVSASRAEAAAIIDKANSEAEKNYDEAISKAFEEANEDYEKIIHSAMWECDMLSESAEKKRDDAVALIVKKVMGSWRS